MSEQPKDIYLLVEGEPYLSICQYWKQRTIDARKAAFAFAKKYGANGFFGDLYGDLSGLPVVDPVPAGWQIRKPARRSEQPCMVPSKSAKGDAIRDEIAALPRMPEQREIGLAIGFPYSIAYKYEGGSGVTSGSGRLDPVQLVWPDRDHLVIFAPNWERVLSELKMENPSCVIISGEWSPPAGLTPISEARYRLLEAQAAVKREELTVA